MSASYSQDSERVVTYRSSGPIGTIDPLVLAKNTHQVFLDQLSEILGCKNSAVDVLHAVQHLKTQQRRDSTS